MHLNNILIIDDDDATCLILKAILLKNDIVKTFNFCHSGAEALEFLKQCEKSQEFPEVVFVDLNMPGMDGFEFIPFYEELFYENQPKTKVAVVTSSMRSRDKDRSLAFKSVSNFINKPLTNEKILSLAT